MAVSKGWAQTAIGIDPRMQCGSSKKFLLLLAFYSDAADRNEAVMARSFLGAERRAFLQLTTRILGSNLPIHRPRWPQATAEDMHKKS